MKEFKYLINGESYIVMVGETKDNVTELSVNGETFTVAKVVEPLPEKKVVKPVAPKAQEGGDELQDALRSPLPGTIIEITAQIGQSVKEGDQLVILEAMKMNNSLTAEKDGVIKSILVQEGESVKENTPLITFE